MDEMHQDRLEFNVAELDVTIEEGVNLMWQGRKMNSGPLIISLGKAGSCGVIDYDAGEVNVEFRVQILFPELAEMLSDLGVDPGIVAPIEGVIRSRGSVFDDHSLRLSGKGELEEHRLFDVEETRIDICAPSQ
ncbi:MAG: hypothetical protein WCD37_16240 [Chloroflexia bacterium]